jgi:hypothetical protein
MLFPIIIALLAVLGVHFCVVMILCQVTLSNMGGNGLRMNSFLLQGLLRMIFTLIGDAQSLSRRVVCGKALSESWSQREKRQEGHPPL